MVKKYRLKRDVDIKAVKTKRKRTLKKILETKKGNPWGLCSKLKDPGNFDVVFQKIKGGLKETVVFQGEEI